LKDQVLAAAAEAHAASRAQFIGTTPHRLVLLRARTVLFDPLLHSYDGEQEMNRSYGHLSLLLLLLPYNNRCRDR